MRATAIERRGITVSFTNIEASGAPPWVRRRLEMFHVEHLLAPLLQIGTSGRSRLDPTHSRWEATRNADGDAYANVALTSYLFRGTKVQINVPRGTRDFHIDFR